MKKLLVIAFLFTSIIVKSQVSEVYKNDSSNLDGPPSYIISEKKLPILKADSCLYDILKTICERTVYCTYFIQNKSCFALSGSNQLGYYLINIRPKYIDMFYPLTRYFGILKFNNINFICYGDNNESLFHESNADSLIFKFKIAILKTHSDSTKYLNYTRLLCDGCLTQWSIICNNVDIAVNAEICNKPIQNYIEKSTRKRKKRIK